MNPVSRSARTASANVAIVVATTVIVLAALLSCFDQPSDTIARWSLRGTIS